MVTATLVSSDSWQVALAEGLERLGRHVGHRRAQLGERVALPLVPGFVFPPMTIAICSPFLVLAPLGFMTMLEVSLPEKA